MDQYRSHETRFLHSRRRHATLSTTKPQVSSFNPGYNDTSGCSSCDTCSPSISSQPCQAGIQQMWTQLMLSSSRANIYNRLLSHPWDIWIDHSWSPLWGIYLLRLRIIKGPSHHNWRMMWMLQNLYGRKPTIIYDYFPFLFFWNFSEKLLPWTEEEYDTIAIWSWGRNCTQI